MTGLERFLGTVTGRETDRRAVSLTLSLYGARFAGCSLETYYSSPIDYIVGQMGVAEETGSDTIFAPFLIAALGEAYGGRAKPLPNQPPNMVEYGASSAQEALALDTPDVDSHPRLVYTREVVRGLAGTLGNSHAIIAVTPCPCGIAAMMMGLGNWIGVLVESVEDANAVIGKATTFFVDWCNALLTDGASAIAVPNMTATPGIVPRRMAEDFIVPAMHTALAEVRGPVVLHHGSQPLTPNIDLLADLPSVVGFLVDPKDDPTKCREIVGAGKGLIAGPDGPTLAKQTPEQISARCQGLLAMMHGDTHFALGSSAADIALDTPLENIRAMVLASEDWAAEAGHRV